jgi:transposase
MNDKELYTNILGITAPWKIDTVKLDLEAKTVTVFVEYDRSQKVRCPICNEKAILYDHTIRRWRHLDTCQMTTIIECDVPRISCCNHKIKQMPVPWAESASHFTALFEALAINWMLETSISGTAELLRLTWDEAAGIKDRAVERRLLKRKDQPMKHIAIDETSFQKRHEYVTIIQDKNNSVVIDVLNDRKSETLEEWLKNRPKEHKESILSISMDM